jgi:glycerol-3-phosphate dehydrogenase
VTVTAAGPLPDVTYDVAIVGAGVVGAAIARELARHHLRIALVEAAHDVGTGTSKANTAILHTGFDAPPDTLEARLVRDGWRLLSDYAAEVGIPVEPVGALVVAWDSEQLAALAEVRRKAERNGHRTTRMVALDELRRREPHLGPMVRGALDVPGESIICPWTTTLAFVTQAVGNGVDLHLDARVAAVTAVTAVTTVAAEHHITTNRGVLRARYLINTAGLYADDIDALLRDAPFRVTPRRGELIVFDKFARPLLDHILLPVPSARSKGVLVAPTVYGNVLLGPTADDIDDKTATASSAVGLEFLREKGATILPRLLDEEVTAVYAGLRAHAGGYRIEVDADRRYLLVGGIRSTGLTAAMAIAQHVVGLLDGAGLPLGPPRDLPAIRMPNLGEASPRPYQDDALIAADPEYGALICHCERVSRGEIRDALASPVPPASLDGLRRRTRALNGRCQGFYCGAAVRALLDRGIQ